MSCGGQNVWLLDYGLVEEEIQGSEFIYMVDDPPVSSVILGFDAPRRDDGGQDNSAAKKRSRPESSAQPGTKACREKLRRDKLNERFNELCAVLEPGKPPKADKVAILSDAARLLDQLRAEALQLKTSNESLQDSIKSLKSEKLELRDEKTKLKAERERLEQCSRASALRLLHRRSTSRTRLPWLRRSSTPWQLMRRPASSSRPTPPATRCRPRSGSGYRRHHWTRPRIQRTGRRLRDQLDDVRCHSSGRNVLSLLLV